MNEVSLRICRVCYEHKVKLFEWMMGRRACQYCMNQVIKDEMEKYDREVEETAKELEDLKRM